MEVAQNWIDEWLLLWPADIKSGGETIRTKAKYIVNKMQTFCQKHPLYTKSIIFAATKNYLAEREADKWFGVRRATYFIDKLGVGSLLDEYCDRILAPKPVTVVLEYDPSSDFI